MSKKITLPGFGGARVFLWFKIPPKTLKNLDFFELCYNEFVEGRKRPTAHGNKKINRKFPCYNKDVERDGNEPNDKRSFTIQ